MREVDIPLNILKILILLANFKLQERYKVKAIQAYENIKITANTAVRTTNRIIRKRSKYNNEIQVIA